MTPGITDDGRFERKFIDEISEDLQRRVENELGNVDLNQSSPIKQLIDVIAIEIAQQWEESEENYYIGYYQDSYGEALDKLLALAGFSRRQLTGATGEVQFEISDSLTSPTRIEEGFEVAAPRTQDKPRIPFKVTEDVSVGVGDDFVTAPISGMAPTETEIADRWLGSETNLPANTITEIPNKKSGINSVTNPEPTGDTDLGYRRGRDRETDAEFKLRYENTLADGGTSTIPAIESYLFQFDEDIESVKVEEVRDPDLGYGPEATVFGPGVSDDDIAQALFESRGAGLESFGAETGIAESEDGRQRSENFNRASRKGIYIDADIVTSSLFREGGIEDITDNLIRFIGGEASDGIDYPGLKIGETVIYDQVKARIMEVQGVVSADVTIGIDPDPTGQSNIDVDNLEVAMTGQDEIDVVVQT